MIFVNIILISGFVLTLVATSFLISFLQTKKTESFISSLKSDSFNKADVMYTKSSQTKTITKAAILYFNDYFLMLRPKSNLFFNIYKPIIITCKSHLFEKTINTPKIITPTDIKFTKWNTLNIEYDGKEFIKFKIIINIRFKDLNDFNLIKKYEINNWC